MIELAIKVFKIFKSVAHQKIRYVYESLQKMSEAYKSRLLNMADQGLKNLTNSNAKRLSSSQTFSEIASPIRDMSSTSNSRTSIVTLLLPRNTNERINSNTDKILYYDIQKTPF